VPGARCVRASPEETKNKKWSAQMTTIFVPISKAQAEWSFLNRAEAFARGFDTAGDGVLSAFWGREQAIAAGREKHVLPFAVLHISFDSTTHESLAYSGKLRGEDGCWTIKPEGCAHLADPANADMLMEIVPGSYRDEGPKTDCFGFPLAPGSGPLIFGC
jgi:hypothetical protein